MRAFAQKQNQPQKPVVSNNAGAEMAASAPTRDAHPILQLQRTIGNQAVKRLLRQVEEPVEAAPPLVDEVLSRAGHPLDGSTRDFMESRFGVDFGQVRIHTDSLAAESAKAVHARAFTVGNDIVFGAAQYAPDSKATRRLLAHELTHVVQQRLSVGRTDGKMPVIQRQRDPSQRGRAQTGSGAAASLRREYITLACEAIATIRTAVVEGRTWDFESTPRLQREDSPQAQQPTLVDERHAALFHLVARLDQLIADLEAGRATPSRPATRVNLSVLWATRNPALMRPWTSARAPTGQPARWSPSFGTRRLPGGRSERLRASLAWYIAAAASLPPGTLRPAPFPTWWVSGCEAPQTQPQPGPQPQPTPTQPTPTPQGGRIIPGTRELPFNSLIYISRTISRTGEATINNWHWEPRRARQPEGQGEWNYRPGAGYYPPSIGTPYEWHYEQSTGRVYIIVDGQEVDLLPNGDVEVRGRIDLPLRGTGARR